MSQNELAVKIIDEVSKAIIGKRECIEDILCAILSGGHILIEDIPGVGKTTLAQAFAIVTGLQQKRIQFTPDVLPSDITGFNMYQKDLDKFVFQPGAIMCNLFLADEINRTSPKTQSALLEVMEENSVTVDGVTYQVPDPFIVIATENPYGYAGTQMLPESQLDRFMICVVMGYPSKEDEIVILEKQSTRGMLENLNKIIDQDALIAMQQDVSKVTVKKTIFQYMVELSTKTREHNYIDLGLSPRGTLALASMAKSKAYMNGRDYVTPEDVKSVFLSVAGHRIRLSSEAKMNHQSVNDVLKQILEQVEAPLPERMKLRG